MKKTLKEQVFKRALETGVQDSGICEEVMIGLEQGCVIVSWDGVHAMFHKDDLYQWVMLQMLKSIVGIK